MKVFTITGYEYKELSPQAKERAKHWYLDDPYRNILLEEDFENAYTEYFFPSSELAVQYGLCYCQGDGVNVSGKLMLDEVIDYIRNWNPQEHAIFGKKGNDPRSWFTECEVKSLLEYIDVSGITSVELPRNMRYGYCMADRLDFVEDMTDELSENNHPHDENLVVRFQSAVIDVITDLCDEMEAYGYDFLYEISDEQMQEACSTNGWYFDESGKFITYLAV